MHPDATSWISTGSSGIPTGWDVEFNE
jgi:hypothetical protein